MLIRKLRWQWTDCFAADCSMFIVYITAFIFALYHKLRKYFAECCPKWELLLLCVLQDAIFTWFTFSTFKMTENRVKMFMLFILFTGDRLSKTFVPVENHKNKKLATNHSFNSSMWF